MRLPFYKKQLTLAVSLATCAAMPLAHANDADEQAIMLEEIVVTAQKREQNMQDTPISMAAFSAEALKKQGIDDIEDAAQYIPNVMAVRSPGGNTGATIGIRGSVTINPAITWEPTVGMYVDGVFVAKNMGGLFDVAELERVEVLRGPQGTLYGKNTIGGAINLVSRKPGEEFGGTLRAKVGNYNYQEEHLSIDTGKFGDVASFNISVNKKDRDGFYKNTAGNVGQRVQSAGYNGKVAKRFGDLDTTAARFAALFDITDDLELFYTYDMSDKDNTPAFGQFDAKGSKLDKRRKSGALDGAIYDKAKNQGHAVHVTWNIADDLTFKSISAYRDMQYKDLNDFDGLDQSTVPVVNGISSFNVYRGFSNEQLSQEFQLIGTSDIADYVVGLYYLNENSDAKNNFDISNTAPVPVVKNKYGVDGESVALFGQADWKLTEALTLTTGLRFTRESKEVYMEHNDGVFSPSVPRIKAKDHWSSVTPMVALSYLWENGINTYVKVAQGWKSGGFNGEAGPSFSGLTAEQVFRQSYDPEKVTSYEVGMKARWWDNRIQTNIAYFYNDIKDMQVSNLGNPAVYSSINNAGKAVMQGVEIDGAIQVIQGLSLTGSYSYLKTKYKKYDAGFYGHNLAGLPEAVFPYAPKQSASVGIDYKVNVGVGDLTARMDYSVVGAHSIFDNPINAAVTRVKRFGLLNGRVALAEMNVGDKQTLEVGFWGKNLTNEEYRINGLPVVDGTNSVVGGANYYGDPRTFGADVTYKW